MRQYFMILFVAMASTIGAIAPADFTWTDMSHNSSESMPVGGGDIGLNVWAENGDILFYISRSGAYDENNTLLKQGRIRINVPGQPISPFSQTLKINEGYCRILLGNTLIDIWADVYKPVVHVEIESSEKITPRVSYENWRYKDRQFRKGEGKQSSWKWSSDKSLKTTRDSIAVTGNGLFFFHRNPDATVFDATIRKEGLDSIMGRLWNPLASLTSGGRLTGKNLNFEGTTDSIYNGTDYRAWNFKASRPAKKHSYTLTLHNGQENLDKWYQTIDSIYSDINISKDRKASRDWWKNYWDRSHISAPANADDTTARMARNYTLFRYMLGCNAYGSEPTKFNGGLFTFDPSHVNDISPFTPDYRNWGGGTMTAQNQRLVYWPMLKSGDYDMMRPQFDFYNRMLPNAIERTKAYWGHDGACFTEQTELFGFPNLMEYGSKRPAGFDPGVEYNAWLEYSWDTILEFCEMILESHRHTGQDISEYRPLIENALVFFDEHYRWLASRRSNKKLDGDDKLVLYPGSACETYKMTNNASSTIAGLKKVTESYIGYLKAAGNTAVSEWTSLLDRIPPIPTRIIDGHEMISPAKTWERINNVETPQLYPVWPWRLYGFTVSDSTDLQTALNTYMRDPDAIKFRSTTGWKQDNIWAAELGLTEEAFRLNSEKLADGKHRFPAFFGPGFDWTPDHNWGGSAMIGLQSMLLQTSGNKIYILPAWPLDRDISFKLHAPDNTTVEATLEGGKLTKLEVSPDTRFHDLILPERLSHKFSDRHSF